MRIYSTNREQISRGLRGVDRRHGFRFRSVQHLLAVLPDLIEKNVSDDRGESSSIFNTQSFR